MSVPEIKCVIVSGPNVKAFNQNNRWSNLGLTENITKETILNSGMLYSVLSASYDNIKLDYEKTDSLEDGTEVYQSEEIQPSWGVSALANEYVDDVIKLKCTIPTFLPKDSLLSTDKIYAYTEDTSFEPYIESVSFSSNETHADAIVFTIKCIYNYDEKVQYRFKVNDGEFTNWSEPTYPYNDIQGQVFPNQMVMGANSITIELRTEDTTKTVTQTMENAINVVNISPQIMIISADSNSFRLHFKIVDENAMDTVSYRLLINNSKYTNEVLEDWSTPVVQPLDKVYYIDTSKVVAGDTNVITIEYKDNYTTEVLKVTYTFRGEYKNILFVDEEGEYYTTDKGAILKIMDLHQIVAGCESEVKKVTIKNNNPDPITHFTLDVIYRNPVEGAKVLLSKGNNPFLALDEIDYGDEIIESGGEKVFYVKMDTDTNAEGMCLFDINAEALPAATASSEEEE